MDIYVHYLDINIWFVWLSAWGGVPTSVTVRAPSHIQALQLLLNGSSRRLEKISCWQASKVFLFTNCYCYSDKIEEDQKGGVCNSTSNSWQIHTKILSENLKVRDAS